MNNVKNLPKRKLISFLRESELDKDFCFPVDIPVTEALNFVHRMRVELSRFREKVRKQSRVPKHFKMFYISATDKDDKGNHLGDNRCIITLRKSQSRNDVSEELDEIFDTIAGGNKLDVQI